jgi:hypothetical protein
MSSHTRAAALLQQADEQIAKLTSILSIHGDSVLQRPCPGRERLGDGTVGALARHTIENYGRTADFVSATISCQAGRGVGDHATYDAHGGHVHGEDARVDELRDQLLAASQALGSLGQLSEEQLAVVPPASEMRFADGQRTLEQIVAGVLKHQRHQIEALAAATGG